MSTSKPVVVYGAGRYTGRLVCEHQSWIAGLEITGNTDPVALGPPTAAIDSVSALVAH